MSTNVPPAETTAPAETNPLLAFSEESLHKLERQAVCELLGHPKTMERVMGLLQTGKPVRN